MRNANTYRKAIRNLYRANRGWSSLHAWKHCDHAINANNNAKLGERQGQCAQARQVLAIDKLQNPSTWPQRANRVLYDFWNGQPHTRVVSRILKELREQMRLDNVRVAA